MPPLVKNGLRNLGTITQIQNWPRGKIIGFSPVYLPLRWRWHCFLCPTPNLQPIRPKLFHRDPPTQPNHPDPHSAGSSSTWSSGSPRSRASWASLASWIGRQCPNPQFPGPVYRDARRASLSDWQAKSLSPLHHPPKQPPSRRQARKAGKPCFRQWNQNQMVWNQSMVWNQKKNANL